MVQQQPQLSPRIACLPSMISMGSTASAAPESIQRKWKSALAPRPASVPAASQAQVADCTASAASAWLAVSLASRRLYQVKFQQRYVKSHRKLSDREGASHQIPTV
jgi:type IV secretory pathway TrbL component